MQAHSRTTVWPLVLAALLLTGLFFVASCDDATKAKTTEKKEPGDETPSDGGGDDAVQFTDFQEASFVIGQNSFTSASLNNGGGASSPDAIGLYGPYSLSGDGNGGLFVADTNNSRVVHFSTIPATNAPTADFVLGQTSFSVNNCISGSFNESCFPIGVHVTGGGELLVTDAGNNRVLVYDSLPTTTGAGPDRAVGQVNLTGFTSGCTSTNLTNPRGVTSAGSKLIIADHDNSRVLIWNSMPTTDGAAASVVTGQDAFNECASEDTNHDGSFDGAIDASTFTYPSDIWSDGTRLVVSDPDNHRVLIWNSIPTGDLTPADVVLGQSDFVSFTSGPAHMDDPRGVDSNGTQLAVADRNNNRVLIWNTFPTSSGTPPDVVLGQGDFTHNFPNDDGQTFTSGSPTARVFQSPTGVRFLGTQLLVSDLNNNRVLIFDGQ